MLMAHRALVGSHQPSLEKPNDAVDPGQQLRGGLLLALENRHLVDVAFCAQAGVATPAVGVDHTARLDGLAHKCVQALGGGIRYLPQTDAPDALPILLSGNDNQGLLLYQPPPSVGLASRRGVNVLDSRVLTSIAPIPVYCPTTVTVIFNNFQTAVCPVFLMS